MYHYMTKKKGSFALLMILLVAEGVAGVFFSLVMSSLVDSVGKSGRDLLMALAGGVAYTVIYILLMMGYHCHKASLIADARCRLKGDIFSGIMGRSVADFDTGNSGEYINGLSNNLNLFEGVCFENIIGVLECVVSFGAAAAICIAVQPLMLVLMLALAFVTLGTTKLTAGSLEKSTERFARSAEEYMAEIKDDFGGFRLVRSFGIIKSILEKHGQKNRQMEDAKRENESRRIVCICIGQFVGLLSTVLVMAAAAYLCLQGMCSVGMVIGFGHLIGKVVAPVTAVPSIVANFRAARPLQRRFEALIARDGEAGREAAPEHVDGVALEEVSFGYQEGQEVLHGLSFRFDMGKHYAVVGSSGSGKTTLMSLLAGYYPAYSGEIRFGGTRLRDMGEGGRSALIGVVSQDAFLFNDTVENNITLYREYAPQEIRRAVEEAGLSGFVASLPEGLQTKVDENGKNLSGGEKQRVSLARAILQKSRILLLDEFTANLDEQTAGEIEQRLLSREDCLIIAVTHRLKPETLRRYDDILVLAQGRIRAAGSYDELAAMGEAGVLGYQ